MEHARPQQSSKPRRARADCCIESECLTGLRNNYYPGKRLTPDSFSAEQSFLNERRHLLNRAVHGWGVVYGYPIAREDGSGRIVIGPGLALDAAGRELVQADALAIEPADLIGFDSEGMSHWHAGKKGVPPWTKGCCWLLSAHYAEQRVDPVTVQDPCSCEHKHWDRVCETVRFSLRRLKDCSECCEKRGCELCCNCATGPCCGDERGTGDGGGREGPCQDREAASAERPNECEEEERRREACESDTPVTRGGCRCLCDHLTKLSVGVDCKELTEIREACGRVHVDLRNGVPLACVKLTRGDCDDWAFEDWIDGCGPRRLVKRNDLLFDLIRGCDLTRIVEVGWRDWHGLQADAPVDFEKFSEAFGAHAQDRSEYVTRDFWVRFSRPVRQDTLRPGCFTMTVLSVEGEGGWRHLARVPVKRIDTTQVKPEPGDPPGHVRAARLVVDGGWLEDGVRGRHSLFFKGDMLVEIEVRGDLILDCNGQSVDANAVGHSLPPTGNGVPGGTFFSSFYVAQRRGAPRAGAQEPTQIA